MPLSEEELEPRVLQAVAATSGMPAGKLKEKLGERGLGLARRLASTHRLFRYAKGRFEWFFPFDPVERIRPEVHAILSERGRLTNSALRAALAKRAPGLNVLLAEWLKGALGVLVFEVPPGDGQKAGLSNEPHLPSMLDKALSALDGALVHTDRAGIPRRKVGAALAERLGDDGGAAPAVSAEALRSALVALAERQGPGSMILVRDLRARLSAADGAVDQAASELAAAGELDLFHHDHPSAADPGELLRVGTVSYVGLALRGDR